MSFDWTISFGNLLSALLIAIGWIVAKRVSSQRDFKNKKREIRTQYLMNAYKIIASSANRENKENENKEFEIAIEQVQFFGTEQQVLLLETAMRSRNFTPLLEDLRKDIRIELELETIPEGIKHFRFDKK